MSFPFELSLAWRYVDGNARQLPDSLAKGLVVWGGFSLFMAMAGFVPLVLPALLLIPPRLDCALARLPDSGQRAGSAHVDLSAHGVAALFHFRHPRRTLVSFFFTAPNLFIVTFALVVVWAYVVLAQTTAAAGRLEQR